MLINYLKVAYPNFLQDPPNITDLTTFYKAAKQSFDASDEFKEVSITQLPCPKTTRSTRRMFASALCVGYEIRVVWPQVSRGETHMRLSCHHGADLVETVETVGHVRVKARRRNRTI